MDGRRADVRISGARIGEVAIDRRLDAAAGEEVHQLSGWLLLPAPAEPHAHLDKALTADRVPNRTGDLMGAIEAWHAIWAGLTREDVIERARQAVLATVANGTTAIRSHVDVSSVIGLRNAEALLELREELRDLVDLQLVALVSAPMSGAEGADHRALLRDALAAGVDVAGGCPHIDPDPVECMERCMEAAATAGRALDLHTDETLRVESLGLRDLAARVRKTGFEHPVTASHCVSLGMQDEHTQAEVAAEVAAAGVAVVTLPQTNLFLQGHGRPVSTPRGLTAVHALLEAGATLAAGADNLQDPFCTVGRADQLETASLLVMAAHLLPDAAYAAVTSGSRAALGLEPVRVAAGGPAELLAIRANTLREAIATACADRLVIHRGRVVASTTTSRTITYGGGNGSRPGPPDTERSHD